MEREVLLAKAPHLSWPLRFVLPHEPHLRPRWMLRLGLFLYDHLDWHMTLPKSQAVDLRDSRNGACGLKPSFKNGFVYSDAWVDDARLVIANVKSAREMGARDLRPPSLRLGAAQRRRQAVEDRARRRRTARRVQLRARGLVNACGPWVKHFLDEQTQSRRPSACG